MPSVRILAPVSVVSVPGCPSNFQGHYGLAVGQINVDCLHPANGDPSHAHLGTRSQPSHVIEAGEHNIGVVSLGQIDTANLNRKEYQAQYAS